MRTSSPSPRPPRSRSGSPAAADRSSPGDPAAQRKPVDPNAPEVSPAGDIPDNQAFVAYTPAGRGYSVKVPEGWARTTAAGATSLHRQAQRASQMQATPAARRRPSRARAARASAGSPGAATGFRAGTVSTVTRTAGTAVRIDLPGELAGRTPSPASRSTDAVERYVFFHDGQERRPDAVAGPKGADNVDPWRIVTDSLRYTR